MQVICHSHSARKFGTYARKCGEYMRNIGGHLQNAIDRTRFFRFIVLLRPAWTWQYMISGPAPNSILLLMVKRSGSLRTNTA